MNKLPSVYKRAGSPVYWGSIMKNGKRKQLALFKNKKYSQEVLAQLREENKGKTQSPSYLAFKHRYLDWGLANKSPLTVYRDKHAFSYLESFAPNLRELTEINISLLEDFKIWLKTKSMKLEENYKSQKGIKRPKGILGNTAINRVMAALKASFRKANEWDLMPEIRWSIVKRLKTPRGRVEFYTVEEVVLMRQKAAEMAKMHKNYCFEETVVMLGAQAGLRRGEMVYLEEKDLDFTKNIISIQPKKGWTPKTNECRDIPMSEELREHLLYCVNLPRRTNRILVDNYGDSLTLDIATTRFKKFVKKCGLKGGVHKLRHTFASHLAQAGVDLYRISKLLGHSSIKTTEIYAHLLPSTLSDAIKYLPATKKPSI